MLSSAENHRHITELSQVLQSGERDRARKEFVDATRAKVLSAAQRHVEERRKKDDFEKGLTAVASPASGSAPSSSSSGGGGGGASLTDTTLKRRASVTAPRAPRYACK